MSIPTKTSRTSLAPVRYPPYSVKSNWTLRQLLKGFTATWPTINPKAIVKRGNLSSTVAAQNFQLGEFLITWIGSETEPFQLQIAHTARREQKLFSSLPGENFIGGAEVELKIFQERGSVEIEEILKTSFANQTVEEIALDGETLVISGHLQAEYCYEFSHQYALSLQISKPLVLDFNLQIVGEKVNQAQLRFATSAAEHFYGFGEQFSRVDCKGYEIPVVTEEGGIGRGDAGPFLLRLLGVTGDLFSSYAPAPHFLTNQGRSLFLSNGEPSVFDLRHPDLATIRVQASQMEGHILTGGTPLDLIEIYTELIGRLPPLPDWVHKGALVGLQGGTEKVRQVWDKLKEYNTPIAGFWLQDWVGQRETIVGKQLWWHWELDHNQYPDWDQFLADLNQAGIAVGIYVNPFLVELPPERQRRRNFYQEAKDKGLLVKRADGTIYPVQNTDFSAALLDLTNPATQSWFKEIIKTEMLGIGAQFWMADFAEAAQFDGQFASGALGLSYHNQYPVDWANLNREAISEAASPSRVWFFTRAGFLKTPGQTTAMWLGDQNVTWKENDGLPSAVDGMLSSGFSGFSINHSDIGGYTSISNRLLRLIGRGFVRSQELLFRWMEMNAFTPIFRTHEGNEPDKNVQFYSNEETYAVFSRWAKVYAALSNYRQKLIQQACSRGYPLVRHPLLHYPNDPLLYRLEESCLCFMLGSELLISPILSPATSRKQVYLPADQWIHLWTGQPFGNKDRGTWLEIAAPLGQPPVFYRQGSSDAQTFVEILKQQAILPL